jgi:hypothetical protein
MIPLTTPVKMVPDSYSESKTEGEVIPEYFSLQEIFYC